MIGGQKPADEDDVLDPEQRRHLSDLFDRQDKGRLAVTERAKLDMLVAAWGRAVNEQGIRDLAARRGVPVEQMRAQVLGDVESALTWWNGMRNDPARLEAMGREAKERQQVQIAG